MRCFISISIPDEIKRGVAAIQERLKTSGADVSWTRPEGMHLTLKFLGEVEEKRLPELESTLTAAVGGWCPFSVDVYGLGVFPSMRRARVVWVGLRDHGDYLSRLQRDVERLFEKIGFPSEGRGFTPHITLGRIRSPKDVEKLLDMIEEDKDVALEGFEVSCVHLMQSMLKPAGAVYRELFSAPLKR